MVERFALNLSVQHPLYSSFPYRASQRSLSSLELSKGNSAPWITGTSVRCAISNMRKVCWVSSFTHWSPLTVVMPRTSNLSDCRKTRMACWSLVPGPRASWSTMTLIFWADAEIERTRASRDVNVRFDTHQSIDFPEEFIDRKFEGRLSQIWVAPVCSVCPKFRFARPACSKN